MTENDADCFRSSHFGVGCRNRAGARFNQQRHPKALRENRRQSSFRVGFDYLSGKPRVRFPPGPSYRQRLHRVVDLEAPASRMQRTGCRGQNPPRGGGQQPVSGNKPDSGSNAGSAQVPRTARRADDDIPYSFLRSAAAAATSPSKPQTMNGRSSPSSLSPVKTRPRSAAISTVHMSRESTRSIITCWADTPFELPSGLQDFGGVIPTHSFEAGRYPGWILPGPTSNPTLRQHCECRCASAGAFPGNFGEARDGVY